MFGNRNVEDEIRKQQEERRKLTSQSKGIQFGIVSNEEEEVNAPAPLPLENEFNKSVAQQYSNPRKFLEETASLIANSSNADPFEKYAGKKKISEREDEYHSRWRKRALSPDRYGENKRSYKELVLGTQLEKQKQDILYKEQKRRKLEEQQQVQNTSISLQPSAALYSNSNNSLNNQSTKWKNPSDAKLPTEKWRLYIFKNNEFADVEHPFIPLHTKSSFTVGRDRSLVDIPIDHLTCSKEHAVICFRRKQEKIIPYLMDLKSANGTLLNMKKIESERFYELKEKDIIQFGQSSREYIILKEETSD